MLVIDASTRLLSLVLKDVTMFICQVFFELLVLLEFGITFFTQQCGFSDMFRKVAFKIGSAAITSVAVWAVVWVHALVDVHMDLIARQRTHGFPAFSARVGRSRSDAFIGLPRFQ
jgi:hypothetical protein